MEGRKEGRLVVGISVGTVKIAVGIVVGTIGIAVVVGEEVGVEVGGRTNAVAPCTNTCIEHASLKKQPSCSEKV